MAEQGGNPCGRISKVSGKADLPWVSRDPKARTRVVADGQQVKFLYCGMTEPVGTRKKAEAGNEARCKQDTRVERQIRRTMGSCEAERNKVAEVVSHASRKAAYCLYRTRTVNRHRWMRRES